MLYPQAPNDMPEALHFYHLLANSRKVLQDKVAHLLGLLRRLC